MPRPVSYRVLCRVRSTGRGRPDLRPAINHHRQLRRQDYLLARGTRPPRLFYEGGSVSAPPN
jgi:hypothetical protein